MISSVSMRNVLAIGAGAAFGLAAVLPTMAVASPKVTSQEVTSTATKALDWLEDQMAANDHHLVSGYMDGDEFVTFDDAGLTIDGLLAIAAAGREDDAEAQETADWVAGNTNDYVTGFDPDSLYSGAVAKALLFAETYGLDYTDIDGRDLEADLRGRLQPSGRFTDDATDFESGDPVDYSNAIGQSFGVLALANTDDGVPASAVTYLLKQQCPNGGFRVVMADAQCTVEADSDTDATSFALTALLGAGDSDAVDTAGEDGVAHLLDLQADDGGIDENANSTGLASAVLRGAGLAPDANKGATFVKTLQLATGADAGAILLDEETYDAATDDGLDDAGRTLATRATAQGVLALGLPAYALIGAAAPVEPSTTIGLSASTVAEKGNVSVSGGGFEAGETVNVVVSSDPVTVGTPAANASGAVSLSFALPASITAGAHTVSLTGATSGVTISAPLTVTAQVVTTTTAPATGVTTTTFVGATTIARGGSSASTEALVATGLLLAGGSLMLSTRRRRIVYPFKK